MGLLLSGRQLHAFFQDPRYWGRGQSFQNLSMRVNGKLVGAPEFVAGWDVADLADEDIVEIVGGTWLPRGCVLASNAMPEVVEGWLRGVVPTPPEAVCPPVALGSTSSEIATHSRPVVNDPPAVKRPSFSLR